MPLVKPAQPVLQRGHPLARGLVGAWLFNERAGTKVRDVFRRTDLTLKGTATFDTEGLRCDAADEGAEVTTPDYLRLSAPLTIVARARVLGTPDTHGNVFGVICNNVDGNPFIAYALITKYNNGFWATYYSNGGNFQALESTIAPVPGEEVCLAAVFTLTDVSLYLNGGLIATQGAVAVTPTYDASSLLAAGDYTGPSRNPNVQVKGGWIYNRALSPREVATLSVDPFAMLRPTPRVRFAPEAAVTVTPPPTTPPAPSTPPPGGKPAHDRRPIRGVRRDLSPDYVPPRPGWGPPDESEGADGAPPAESTLETPSPVATPPPTQADFHAAAADYAGRTVEPMPAFVPPPPVKVDAKAAMEARLKALDDDDWEVLQMIASVI